MANPYMTRRITVRHWFPILTICPVNNLPDFIYVSVSFEKQFVELYQIRKRIKKVSSFRKCFMEEIAEDVLNAFPDAKEVVVNLAFNRHRIVLTRIPQEARNDA